MLNSYDYTKENKGNIINPSPPLGTEFKQGSLRSQKDNTKKKAIVMLQSSEKRSNHRITGL